MNYHLRLILGSIIWVFSISLTYASEINKSFVSQKNNSNIIAQSNLGNNGQVKIETIEIEVTKTKPNGNNWDIDRSIAVIKPKSGKTIEYLYKKPDITICLENQLTPTAPFMCLVDDLNSKIQASCQDSQRCIFNSTYIPSNRPKFVILDLDAVEHDVIGKGYCELNSECQLGQAKVRILSSTPTSDSEWAYIIDFLTDFYNSNRTNSSVVAFAVQMLNIAKKSYNQPWAGEFTKSNFLTAIDDINTNKGFWSSPSETCDTYKANHLAPYDCGFITAGNHHLERHIIPGFNQHIESALRSALANNQGNAEAITSTVNQIITEHERFLKEAILVGLEANHSISSMVRKSAQLLVPKDARNIRNKAFDNVIAKLKQEGHLSSQDISTIQSGVQYKFNNVNTNNLPSTDIFANEELDTEQSNLTSILPQPTEADDSSNSQINNNLCNIDHSQISKELQKLEDEIQNLIIQKIGKESRIEELNSGTINSNEREELNILIEQIETIENDVENREQRIAQIETPNNTKHCSSVGENLQSDQAIWDSPHNSTPVKSDFPAPLF